MNAAPERAALPAPPQGKAKCADCRFFRKAETHYIYGDCKRLPPQFNFSAHFRQDDRYSGDGTPPRMTAEIMRFQHGVWPSVHQDEWCGEFSPLQGNTLERTS